MQFDSKKDDVFIQRSFVGDDDEEPRPGIVCYHAPGNTELKKIHVPTILDNSTDEDVQKDIGDLNKSKTSFNKKNSTGKSPMKSLKPTQ
jgi:hypothetical protein